MFKQWVKFPRIGFFLLISLISVGATASTIIGQTASNMIVWANDGGDKVTQAVLLTADQIIKKVGQQ